MVPDLISRSRWIWVPGLVFFLMLLGCGRRDAPPEAIRIGVLVNLAGSEGQPTEESARLAVDSVNAAGGLEVDGRRRPVELLFEDTQAAPEGAMEGARRLIQQNVVAIVGPNRSRDAIAAGGVAENARVPMISPASTHPETTAGKPYVFRVAFTDPLQGRALGRFAAEELGARTAAVLFDVASAYNRNLATVFQQSFETAGGKIVAFEHYTTGDEDFSQQLKRIRDRRPRVLLLPNYTEDVPLQARQARDLGIDATLLGVDSWNLIPVADLPQLEGGFFARYWHLDEAETNREAHRFVTAYRQAYGRAPSHLAAVTYDAFGLLFRAIASAGDDPDGIRRTLAEIEGYPGVTGTITYRDTDGDPLKRLFIAQIREGEVALFKAIEPPPAEPSGSGAR